MDRHSGLVYHAALRQLGNPHAAEEVTQAVFIALAQKAAQIPRGSVLSGWLFRAARYAVSNLAREEVRRQRREQEAATMATTTRSDETESAWEQISPHLNDALEKLSDRDREAVLIRFFQDKSHREVAGALGVSEDAAKVRVSRAVEKLRMLFAKQGFAVPSAVLLAALTAHSAQAAPAGLNAAVATAAAAKGTAGAASTLTLAKGILKLMAWSKTKTAIVAGVALLLAGVTTSIVLQQTQSILPSAKADPVKAVAALVDRSTPKGSLLAMSQALETGDAALFLGTFDFASPDEDAIKSALAQLVTTIGRYRRAAIEQFGAEPAQASFDSLPFRLPLTKIAAATISVEGERMRVQLDPRDRPAMFTQTNGEWRTTVDGFYHMNPSVLSRMGTILVAEYERVLTEMKSGRYKSALDAAQAVHARTK
ncbi:MAG: sigma-70 family RNA polymerase sigma factor [Verrucomicrobia bacterium]|nr:sigma-70 family RNA polymerase sigma factor [Verrucomicrobiota bacterium]